VTRFQVLLLTLLSPLFVLASIGAAQDGALILNPSVDYTFGEEIRFSLQAQHAADLQDLTLVFRPELSANIYEVEVPFQPGETISVTEAIDVKGIDLRPFSEITYSWEYETTGGPQKLPDQVVSYEDDSYQWQKMTANGATVHWVGEAPPFGQSILDMVDDSLHALEELIPLESIAPIDLYVYPNMAELRDVLPQPDSENFQTSQLDLGVILLTTANAQMAETDLPQSVPNELAHLLLYRAAGSQYDTLPWWFREGIAGSVQPDDNPQHKQLLQEAVEHGSTIPFRDLCQFPEGPGMRQDLASYQSGSFIRFLKDRQSVGAIPDLLSAYLNGVGCEQGVEEVLGTDLDTLQEEWLANSMEKSPLKNFLSDLWIWIIFLIMGTSMVVLLIGVTGKRKNNDTRR
jgi:hypothetical protein